jgi:hypothetical protein
MVINGIKKNYGVRHPYDNEHTQIRTIYVNLMEFFTCCRVNFGKIESIEKFSRAYLVFYLKVQPVFSCH